jgi:tetratricopeptide (TPR) repeat protein
LKIDPDHPAALHYYIHLTEASRNPGIALASAEKLEKLLPGIAHMVHMASHEYERNGWFAPGVESNDKADNNLLTYDSLAKNISLTRHSPHFFAVQTYCAMSGAMYKESVRASARCRKSVSPVHQNSYDQYLYMLPLVSLVRLGRWEEILRENTEPDKRWPNAGLLYNFARGMAFVYTGQPDSAQSQLLQLRSKALDPVLNTRRIPFNSASQVAGIADGILNAAILFAEKKSALAIASLEKAIRIEDSLVYTEPKDWMIPARQYLGAYLLQLGRSGSAEKVYREDLAWNPGNGWSLLGLCQSLQAQHKNKKLAVYKAGYQRSFSKAEKIPPSSAFIQ